MVDFLPSEIGAIMLSGARTGEAGEFIDVVIITVSLYLPPLLKRTWDCLQRYTVQQNKNSNNAIGAD